MKSGNEDLDKSEDPLAVLGPDGERELKRERGRNHMLITAFFVLILIIFEYLTGNL